MGRWKGDDIAVWPLARAIRPRLCRRCGSEREVGASAAAAVVGVVVVDVAVGVWVLQEAGEAGWEGRATGKQGLASRRWLEGGTAETREHEAVNVPLRAQRVRGWVGLRRLEMAAASV